MRSSGSFRPISPVSSPGACATRYFTNAQGGILDDLMVVNGGDHVLLVVNAACKDGDYALVADALGKTCSVEMLDRALIALQGPQAEAALAVLAPDCASMKFLEARTLTIMGAPCLVMRSGYTGEDGFEISTPSDLAREIAEELLANAAVAPAGLGARDSLRLEAGLPLYGSDIDETTTPVEAGLAWAIQNARRNGGARQGGFPGDGIILRQIAQGAPRARVGLRPAGQGQEARAIVRGGAALYAERGCKDSDRRGHLRRLRPEPRRPDRDGLRAGGARRARNPRFRRASRQAAAFDRDSASLHHAEIQAELEEDALLKFTEEHEWLKLEGDVATVGITAHATELLGDLVFVELPDPGAKLKKGDSAAVVESVKAASDIYAPLAGEVVEVNQAIVDDPALVNADPHGGGWFFKLKLADKSAMEGLMDEAAYRKLIE